MTTLVSAICKGKTLMLEKPLDLPEDTPVMIAILTDDERDAWFRTGDKHFASAYGSDEPEYSLDDVVK